MKIDVNEIGSVVVLKVGGNLMGGPETIAIHEKIKELIKENKKQVVIDLSKVAWMNSSGLGTLMGCMTSLRNVKGELKLSGVTEKVKNLFIITKLITLFDTYDTEKDAIEAFKKS
ncbi:MAG TPA: STAS domain-containing protein [bacterium]